MMSKLLPIFAQLFVAIFIALSNQSKWCNAAGKPSEHHVKRQHNIPIIGGGVYIQSKDGLRKLHPQSAEPDDESVPKVHPEQDKESVLSWIKHPANAHQRQRLLSGRPEVIYKRQGTVRMKFPFVFKNLARDVFVEPPHKDTYCTPETKILVIVLSNLKDFEMRDAIRHSYGADFPDDMRLMFVVGRPPGDLPQDQREKIERRLKQERERHKSQILEVGIPERYANLHFKTQACLHYRKRFCPGARYLMRIDTDMVMAPRRLRYWIRETYEPLVNKVPHRLAAIGWKLDNIKVTRNPDHHWFVPERVHPNPFFNNYLIGTAIIWTRETADALCDRRNTQYVTMHSIDDAVVGDISKRAHVRLIQASDHIRSATGFEQEERCSKPPAHATPNSPAATPIPFLSVLAVDHHPEHVFHGYRQLRGLHCEHLRSGEWKALADHIDPQHLAPEEEAVVEPGETRKLAKKSSKKDKKLKKAEKKQLNKLKKKPSLLNSAATSRKKKNLRKPKHQNKIIQVPNGK